MQGIPPNNQNPRGGSPGFRMNTNQPPRPLQVQQSRLAPQGRPAVQNQRIPAVNTLKAGGPRLAPVPPAKPEKKADAVPAKRLCPRGVFMLLNPVIIPQKSQKNSAFPFLICLKPIK